MPKLKNKHQLLTGLNLKLRMSLYISIVVISSALISIYINFIKSYEYLYQEKLKEIIKVVKLGKENIELDIENVIKVTDSLKYNSQVISYLSTERPSPESIILEEDVSNLLNNINIDNRYLALYILDKEGNALISTDERFLNYNFAFRKYYTEAKAGNIGIQATIGTISKELGYYFSAPIIIGENNTIGVIVIKMRPEIVNSSLERIKKDTNSQSITLIDENNKILYSSDNKEILQDLGSINAIKYKETLEIKNKYEDITTLIDPTNKEHRIIISRVNESPYFIIMETNIKSILNILNQDLVKRMLITFLIAILVIIIVAYTTIYKLLKPLNKLEMFARDISSGNFLRLDTNNFSGEFKNFAFALNEMSRKLKNIYGEMEESIKQKTEKANDRLEEQEKAEKALMNILEDLDNQNKTIESKSQELQKFKLAVDNTYDHVIITDPEGTILYANKSVERITGFQINEIIGTKAGVLWGKIMEPDFYKKMWQTIKIEKNTYTGSIKNHRKNGEIYEAFTSISPVLNDKKEVLFFVGIERDISEEKRIDQMKTDFISLASHQLRTPLSAMRWYLEMLLNGDMGKLKKEQTDLVENLDKSNKRMIDLVDSLLDITRLESGKITVEPAPCNAEELLRDVLQDIGTKFENKKQTLEIDIKKNLQIFNIDPKLTRQVFLNLITNANKYTQEKGTINIKLGNEKDTMVFEIKDNGYGIPETDKKNIFKKFYRAQNIIKNETEGTGLGLYLIKIIVEASNGTIEFDSKENKGTTFTIKIPNAKDTKNNKQSETSIEIKSNSTTELKNKQVKATIKENDNAKVTKEVKKKVKKNNIENKETEEIASLI